MGPLDGDAEGSDDGGELGLPDGDSEEVAVGCKLGGVEG